MEIQRRFDQRGVRIAAVALAFTVLTAVTVVITRWAMFVVTQPFEDEGYMLTVLNSFVHHGNMYDDVFGQYGPFYYATWGGLFSGLGLPLTPDAGREVTAVVWILTALGAGVATMRITGSALLGLATQMAVFSALLVLPNEPMHPLGLIGLLLVVLLLASTFVGRDVAVGAAAVVGGTVGALLMVKINVGGFALIALALICAVVYPSLARWRWLRPAVEALFVLTPLLLMAGELGEAAVRHYAVHVSVAALALVLVLRALAPPRRLGEELGWMAGGLVAVVFVSCLAIVGSGTSLSGLVYGVVRQPLRQSDAFRLPLELAGRYWYLDLIALAAAAAFLWFSRTRTRPPSQGLIVLASVLSIGVGLEMALSVIGKALPLDFAQLPGHQFSFLAFCWVALIPVARAGRSGASFARLLLPPLALLQSLHAFPVAGSQIMLGTFLLIPVGALCVANGVRGLALVLDEENERRTLTAVGACAAAALLLFVAGATLRDPWRASHAAYDASPPLDLPGERNVHMSPALAQPYREVTAAIDRNCRTFLTMPGMGYFYIWSQQEPPTGYNATAWMTLFDDKHQQRVVDDTRSIRGLCLLRNMGLAEGWSQGPVPPGPLVSYLEKGFRPLVTIGPYELLRREGPAPTS